MNKPEVTEQDKSGWILLHRKILDNPLWCSEPFTKSQAWIDLLLLAAWKDTYTVIRGIRVDLKRGQVGMSEVNLSARWQWSRKKIRKYLSYLQEREHQITQQKWNVTTIITIVNYDQYQIKGIAEDTAKDTAKDTANHENPQIFQVVTTPKEVKEYIKTYSAIFETFWLSYPDRQGKKIGKKEAATHFDKLQNQTEVIEAAKRYGEYCREADRLPKDAFRWLKNEMWKDWTEEVKQESPIKAALRRMNGE